MKKIIVFGVVIAAMLAFVPSRAEAYKVNDDHQIYGYGQIWLLLSEDAKEGDTVQTAGGDDGATTAFGFRDRRLRFGIKGDLMNKVAYYNIFMDGAGGTVKLLDYWFGVRGGNAYVQFGRFRPFITWETSMTSAGALKNVDRDAGLTNITAKFFATPAAWRDLGMLIGYGDKSKDPLSILFSVSDGTGANAAVGGDALNGAVYSNAVGDAAYSIGIVMHLGHNAQLNASYSMNKHNGATLSGSEKSAIDIDRTAYSVSGEYEMLDGLIWIDGEYANLKAGSKDYAYADAELTAYYARLGFYIMPTRLELVGRMASESDKGFIHGDPHHEHTTDEMAVTMNYYLGAAFKAQLEYASFSPEGESSYATFRSNLQINF